MATKSIVNNSALLNSHEVFGDNEEHEYLANCFDGYAICTPLTLGEPYVKLTYPKLSEVRKDDEMSMDVLTYCGLHDLSVKDINYSDIMQTYGEISLFN